MMRARDAALLLLAFAIAWFFSPYLAPAVLAIAALVLLRRRIATLVEIYRVHYGVEKPLLAALASLAAAAVAIKGAPALAKAFALALAAAALAMGPWRPRVALSAAALAPVLASPLAGFPRAAALVAAAAAGALLAPRLVRGGLVKLWAKSIDPARILEELSRHKAVVVGRAGIYAYAEGGTRGRVDGGVYYPEAKAFVKCRRGPCAPLRMSLGEEAVRNAAEAAAEAVPKALPEPAELRGPLAIYARDAKLAAELLAKFGRVYVLGGGGRADANPYDLPPHDVAKAAAELMAMYGVGGREAAQYLYLLLRRKKELKPEDLAQLGDRAAAEFLAELFDGLGRWPEDRVVELGDGPRSVFAAYLLWRKFGGYVLAPTKRLFEELRRLGVEEAALLLAEPTEPPTPSYIIVGPMEGLKGELGKYAARLGEREYIGYTAGRYVAGEV